MERVGRNDPCPCGSGKRYKHCCGRLGAAEDTTPQPSGAPAAAFNLAAVKKEALELHARGELIQASALYRKILLHSPKDFGALHMLGVIQAQEGRSWEALRLIHEAASLELAEQYPPVFENLCRAIADVSVEYDGMEKLLCPDLAEADRPLRVFTGTLPDALPQLPLVSIVIPCHNHESCVAAALRSVYAQSYPNIEIIIIDDGSRDRSVEKIKEILGESPYPVKLVARENRGTHATLNEGIELAGGSYIGILDPDDLYLPTRVDSLVKLLVSTGREWGFSGVKFINDQGEYLQYGQDEYSDTLMRGLDRLYSDAPITIGCASFNYAITTGNLFFSKSLWSRIGGFPVFKYRHDWDFCLRALEHESPAVLHEPAYAHRLHERNETEEDKERSSAETAEMLLAWGRRDAQAHQTAGLRERLIACARDCALIAGSQSHLIDRNHLLELARHLLARRASGGA